MGHGRIRVESVARPDHPHEDARGHLGQVAHQCDEGVVPVRIHDHGMSAEATHVRLERGGRLRIRPCRRGQHPCNALDQRCRSALGPAPLGAAHGVASHEPSPFRRGCASFDLDHNVSLHASDVGDERCPDLEALRDDRSHRLDRRAYEDQVGRGGAVLHGGSMSKGRPVRRRREDVGIAVESGHGVARPRPRHGYRAADQTGPDDPDPLWLRGHREAPRRRRGTRVRRRGARARTGSARARGSRRAWLRPRQSPMRITVAPR